MIYLDNAASTAPEPEVRRVLDQAAADLYANPSSAHGAGAAAARALERAREAVARTLGASDPRQVVFTSGGTEADALGVVGAARRARGRHLVVTAIEHPAVLRAAQGLAGGGAGTGAGAHAGAAAFEVSEVAVGPSGVVDVAAVVAALRPDTSVVAVMLVNNELGTVQPVAEVARALDGWARAAGRPKPHLHVDAVQAFGVLRIRVEALGADSVAVSGHKIHGPKGTGALWLRQGARVAPLWEGGGQEQGLRSGTENLPGVVGLGRAAELAAAAQADGAGAAICRLRDDLEARVLSAVAGAGARRTVPVETPRAPHISSLALPGLPAEPLLHALEARGIVAAAGSACASKTRGPSHVLKAIGVDDDTAVLRFSLSRHTTAADIAAAAAALADAAAEIAEVASTAGSTGSPARRRR